MKYTQRDSINEVRDHYKKYLPEIRQLFNHSCAYCTLTEGENNKGFFHIDHFRPKKKFPSLEIQYPNLYYSCHKCNVHKTDTWIAEDDCIRNCSLCKTNLCRSNNFPRFIDPCMDNPLKHIKQGDDYNLIPSDESELGKYTIETLRLNRGQLVKLRKSRVQLLMWLNDKLDRLEKTNKRIENAKNQLSMFTDLQSKIEDRPAEKKESLKDQMIIKLFEQKIALYEKEKTELEIDLKRISDKIHSTTEPFDW